MSTPTPSVVRDAVVAAIESSTGTTYPPGTKTALLPFFTGLAPYLAGAAASGWFSGATVPGSGVGGNGDFYFHTGTYGIYFKVSGTWYLVGSFLSETQRAQLAAYNELTTDTALNATHGTVSATTASITVTLPTAVGIAGRKYTIDNASAGDIYVTGTGGQTISGVATQTIASDSCMVVFSNGANWRIC